MPNHFYHSICCIVTTPYVSPGKVYDHRNAGKDLTFTQYSLVIMWCTSHAIMIENWLTNHNPVQHIYIGCGQRVIFDFRNQCFFILCEMRKGVFFRVKINLNQFELSDQKSNWKSQSPIPCSLKNSTLIEIDCKARPLYLIFSMKIFCYFVWKTKGSYYFLWNVKGKIYFL